MTQVTGPAGRDGQVRPADPAVLRALRDVVGAEHLLDEPSLTEPFGRDWTSRWCSLPVAVVRPASTEQVAAVVGLCAKAGLALVTQGGNTGLVGGSVPHSSTPAVVVATTRLTSLGAVDTSSRQVTVGAGVPLGVLQSHAAASGLRYAVDLAARDSATVGGTVATNAGGLRVLAFGDTRRQVVGVEAVLADSSVVSRLSGLVKDNSGYDLSQLLVGSEGTLGVITAARVRLLAPPEAPPIVVLVGLPSAAAALDWLNTPRLVAAELMLHRGLALVEQVAGLPHPLHHRHPAYLLMEVEGELPARLADYDTAVGPSLWAYRERHTEVIATRGLVHKMDIAVPIDQVEAAIHGLDELLAGALTSEEAPSQAYLFGHVGDGNLHLNVVHPRTTQVAAMNLPELEGSVYGLVAHLGGTVAAEHGVGVAKVPWLRLCRSPAELAAQQAVRQALDPQRLFNPDVLL